MEDYGHVTVLLNEAVDLLDVDPTGVYVDATLGGGGHTSKILSKITTGKLYSFDQDLNAIQFNQQRFKDEIASGKLTLIHSNFANLKFELNELGVEEINGILFDLGVSSPQFDDEDRGFSYRFDAKLDMRMDQNQNLSAYQVVNDYPLAKLTSIIEHYGEDKFAKAIARNIVANRPIETTFQLVDVIRNSKPEKVLHTKGHPAKQAFQAIRIEVNAELDVLKKALEQGSEILKKNGRMSVITFHSLEDRIVKRFFVDLSTPLKLPNGIPVLDKDNQADFKNLTNKPILSTPEELEINHRAASAKLRGIERIK
ncbi:MAG: 16S rRNA (cytosine(1402)-N(4))-methyltransferase RsmH [Lactobacillaceae bacterium]|jgi:16S rRNA (cytosine1402-N4)-methyltransferase|nr:16S rRNA (cytosine(1402)-N(4))-methyltransferase RsmH [Lactobacillaceae bacterium]